ncbi:DNA-binding response regulator, LuxR family [Fulvivirga imtechensis AK7]|uniref:DNA-binding response regulator, LuxR family n=1 Tax=Fulvivirga imtechensis AK7 TaxID=1237149 RepID=L8JNC3_9BACT|nr:response regulator transcription factor [Fulvivirga imtechensis]ELR69034.1 DNA-binding response regulator, LuxR family [Fulvivirga imtechensis AK7]
MSKIKVYIADDQTLFRKGMGRLVRSFPNVSEVKEASNGKELLDLIKEEKPDVILMDLEMPVMDGIEATEKVLAKYPNIKIVVLSMHDSQQHIFYLMELGAHAFLLKNAEPEEVQEAINAVLKNDFYQNQLVVEALRKGAMDKKKAEMRPVFQNSASLTDREKEILLLICRELTMKEISDKLSLSEKTVHNHRARMMDKLGVRNTVGLVKYAYDSGLLE